LRRAAGAAHQLVAPFVAATTALSPGPAGAGEKEDLEALRKRVERLRDDLAGVEESRSEAADQLLESERAISEANRALRDIEGGLVAARGELRDIDAEAARLAVAPGRARIRARQTAACPLCCGPPGHANSHPLRRRPEADRPRARVRRLPRTCACRARP